MKWRRGFGKTIIESTLGSLFSKILPTVQVKLSTGNYQTKILSTDSERIIFLSTQALRKFSTQIKYYIQRTGQRVAVYGIWISQANNS